jgi:hypothetical protein
MSENEQNPIDQEELEGAAGEPLPDREAMSIIVTPGDELLSFPVEPPGN